MKKIGCLLLLIMLFGTIRVWALEDCTDYLDYITTSDTIAYTDSSKEYNINSGTEFKMCQQTGGDSIVEFSDGKIATSLKEGTYRLKDSFDLSSAHPMEPATSFVVNNTIPIYTDPSGLTKSDTLMEGTKVIASYYYGPYYYVKSDSKVGWVYEEYLDDEIVSEDEEDSDSKDSFMTIAVPISVVVLLIGLIVIIRDRNNKKYEV